MIIPGKRYGKHKMRRRPPSTHIYHPSSNIANPHCVPRLQPDADDKLHVITNGISRDQVPTADSFRNSVHFSLDTPGE